jgi:hypothetical protein
VHQERLREKKKRATDIFISCSFFPLTGQLLVVIMWNNMLVRYWFKAIIILTVLILLGGCVTAGPLSFTGDASPRSEGLVFGHIKVVVNNRPINWTHEFLGPGVFYVFVLPDDASEATYYSLSQDGFFCWTLPPGKYAVAGFMWIPAGLHEMYGRLFARFEVVEGQPVRYIGTLKITFQTKGVYGKTVENECEVAQAQFKLKYPTAQGEITQDLMNIEKEP